MANLVPKHQPVSDEDFFQGLSQNGLELAADYLEDDLDKLQENGLPVAGTVKGLLTVHSLQDQDEQEEDTESA
jgi:hypothetical protein